MSAESIVVTVDADLEDLIPGFMERRHGDVQKLRAALSAGDLKSARIIGHSLKGTAGGYGFSGLSAIGAAIETAARDEDAAAIVKQVDEMEHYLSRVDIRFR